MDLHTLVRYTLRGKNIIIIYQIFKATPFQGGPSLNETLPIYVVRELLVLYS